MQSHQLAQRIAHLILEKKGSDVVIMNLKKLTTMADYFVVASADSDIQAKAITEHIQTQLSKQSLQPWHVEGLDLSTWVLLDFIDVVVHVFLPETRDFYGLERLWGDADIQEIKDPDATSKAH